MKYFDQLLGAIVAWRGYRVLPQRLGKPLEIHVQLVDTHVELSLGWAGQVDASILLSAETAKHVGEGLIDHAAKASAQRDEG